jgi:glycosyltransferase involved in cell wall biosynthesis
VTEPGLVSVIIATYNGAARIAAAIESVRAQTYPSWEVIVAVDGSSDNTADVVEGFRDERISVLSFAVNRGPAAARNSALAEAHGEFIAYLDDDDAWLPGKLAAQVAMLSADADLGLVHGGVVDVMEDGRRLVRMPPRDAAGYRANLLRDCIALSTVVVRRTVLERTGEFEPSLRAFEDWELWTRLLRLYPSAFVPDVVATTRQRSGSAMHGSSVYDLARARALVVRRRWRTLRAHGLGRRALAYHHYFVGGLFLVHGRKAAARRRAVRSLRLRPSMRAGALYVMSFLGAGPSGAAWRGLQRLRRLVRA